MSKLIQIFALSIVFVLLLAACRVGPDAASAAMNEREAISQDATNDNGKAGAMPESVTIGYMGPLTGGGAFVGQEQLGFTKAVAQIYSERWGIEINVVEGDTEINPDTGKIVAEQFAANEAIIGVVGPAGSQVCASTQSVFADAGLAHITPSCTAISLTQPGTPTFFRPIPNDADQSKTIASYMLDTLGSKSAFLVDDQSTYSVGLNDEVEAILLNTGIGVERVSVTQEETDFSSVATTIIASGSDVVLFPSQMENQQSTLAVQLREQGYEGIYFLADGGFALGWIDSAGTAAEGTYVTFFSPDPNMVTEADEMNMRYQEITGDDEFGAFGGASGLTAQVLFEAIGLCIETTDLNRACVVDALSNINLENTVLGIPVSFGEGNQAEGGFSIFQVQKGGFILLQ
ncbi:branched-chain amino acid ABC transporter substrate-binding protein [Chloroflexi bacterium TSY]|nr:branched-chain amino acid ABC transporter substrate-binding protein [Chloroflexi bacterium TSY]